MLAQGLFIESVRRMGQSTPAPPKTRLQRGDIATLYGPESAINYTAKELGAPLSASDMTNFVFLGLGVLASLLIGRLSAHVWGFEVTLGTGGGALIAGLAFGWLNTRRPRQGHLPVAAAGFMTGFGLDTFIAAIDCGAAPDAVALARECGLILQLLGVLVSVIPAIISLWMGWQLMKIDAPILLRIIAGQHCGPPRSPLLSARPAIR